MRVAAGQFVVTPEWQVNAQRCVTLMRSAAEAGASLLVLPEALLARSDSDPDMSVRSAQTLDGGFMQVLLAQSRSDALTTVLTIHTPSGEGRARNTLVALRGGEVIAHYHKLHLYDAFSIQESKRVDAGEALPRASDTTCYLVASGECGTRNIGQSRIIDPLGVTLAGATAESQLIISEIQHEHLLHVRQQLPVLANRRFALPQLT